MRGKGHGPAAIGLHFYLLIFWHLKNNLFPLYYVLLWEMIFFIFYWFVFKKEYNKKIQKYFFCNWSILYCYFQYYLYEHLL